jgi:carboxypeptidase C (cathepsin A)
VVLRDYDGDGRDSDGKRIGDKPRATLFFTAYTLKGVRKPEKRPIVFSFNGGPGSSSVWLHLGILGRTASRPMKWATRRRRPYALVDNEHTLLAEADLVFIDPVGTGHSRMVEGEKVAEFHEYQRDLDAVGEFIRLYLARYGAGAARNT